MTRIVCLVEWSLGLILSAWLFWKSSATYVLSGMAQSLVILLLYMFVAMLLRRKLPAERRPLLLAGLSVILSLCLVVRLTRELSLVAFPGWSSKEMRERATTQHIPPEFASQWFVDEIARIKSQRDIYTVMSAILCLLYWRTYHDIRAQQCAIRSPTSPNTGT
jgi:hypothetical protein